MSFFSPGTMHEMTLGGGESLRVDTGCLVAMEASVDYDIQPNITYGTANNTELKLDLYLPKERSKPSPPHFIPNQLWKPWKTSSRWEVALAPKQYKARSTIRKFSR